MSADMIEPEDVHAYLALLAGSGHSMWGGIDISAPLGRRHAAKWFIDQIEEIEAMRHQIRAYESWAHEADEIAKAEREAAAARQKERAIRAGWEPVIVENTDEYNRHLRSVTP